MGFLVVVFWAVMFWGFFCLLVICFGGFCFVLCLLGCLVLFRFGFGFRVVFCVCYLRPMPNSVCSTRWVKSVE